MDGKPKGKGAWFVRDKAAVAKAAKRDDKRPRVKQFSCKFCGGQVEIRLPGKSLVAGCQSCHAIVDATDENHQVISVYAGKATFDPVLPLGGRGKIRGETYEVVGYLRKCDETGVYYWEEYLLFNPYQGYRWLVQSQGHWNYVIPLRSSPEEESGLAVVYNQKSYRLFLRGKSEVVYVLGEFYWRVKHNDQAHVSDYVAAPELLSMEKTADEVAWSLGEYIDGETVRKAFRVKGAFPVPVGVAPNQPSPISRFAELKTYTLRLLAVLFLLQAVSAAVVSETKVMEVDLSHRRAAPTREYLSEPFELTGRTTNVASILKAPVNNHWLEVEMSLVNDATGASTDFRQLAEYYHGYDSDGSWSEGSQTDAFVVPRVPSGRYRLRAEPSSDVDTNYNLQIWRDRVHWSNFWFLASMLLAFPMLVLLRGYHFEMARWRDSEYAPGYIIRNSDEGEDD